MFFPQRIFITFANKLNARNERAEQRRRQCERPEHILCAAAYSCRSQQVARKQVSERRALPQPAPSLCVQASCGDATEQRTSPADRSISSASRLRLRAATERRRVERILRGTTADAVYKEHAALHVRTELDATEEGETGPHNFRPQLLRGSRNMRTRKYGGRLMGAQFRGGSKLHPARVRRLGDPLRQSSTNLSFLSNLALNPCAAESIHRNGSITSQLGIHT